MGPMRYRKRYCTKIECKHEFPTWETTESPMRLRTKYRTKEQFNAERRDYIRQKRLADPEALRLQNKRWKLRRQARAEAAETNRPVQELYEAWGVS